MYIYIYIYMDVFMLMILLISVYLNYKTDIPMIGAVYTHMYVLSYMNSCLCFHLYLSICILVHTHPLLINTINN